MLDTRECRTARAAAAVAVACLTAVAARAQTAPRLVTLTDVAPLVLDLDPSTCASARCVPAGMLAPATASAGGVAYDAAARGVWISDGTTAARIDLDGRCAYQCPPQPLPDLTPGQPVTGLAFDETTDTLLAVDAGHVLRRYAAQGCALQLVSRCALPATAGETPGGLATDDLGGRVFVAVSSFGSGGVAGGTVLVTTAADPCAVVCSFAVRSCGGAPLGPITGLAYDPCSSTLWVTDERRTVGGVVSFGAAGCTWRETGCCTSAFGETFTGLALVPGGATSSGSACSDQGCPSCRGLRHELQGSPTLGNPSFGLALRDAPAATSAWAVLGAGACTTPGTPIPPFCGPLLVPVAPAAPVVLGPVSTGGTSGRCGDVVLPLPLPRVPALCGVVLSTQFLGACASSGATSTYVTQCLSWRLSTG